MTPQLTVSSPRESAETVAALATLPLSLHRTAGDTELVGVQGGLDWVDVAAHAIESGARGVLVIDPVAADTAALEEVATSRRVPVVIDSTWAHNPAVGQSAEAFRRLGDGESLVVARVNLPVGADLMAALLDQLSLLRAALLPVSEFELVRLDAHGYDACGQLTNGVRVTLAGILSDSFPPSATLRLIMPTEAVELAIPTPDSAAPGRAVVSGPEGETLLPTQYESARRVAWRRLRDLAAQRESSADLAGFADDVRVLRNATAVLPVRSERLKLAE
jgi:hypothetical protein